MTSSIHNSDESRYNASSAGISIAVFRPLPRRSRNFMSLVILSRLASIPFSFNCLNRIRPLSYLVAAQNTLISASAKTTVPITRTSATNSGRCFKSFRFCNKPFRTAGYAAIFNKIGQQRNAKSFAHFFYIFKSKIFEWHLYQTWFILWIDYGRRQRHQI